MARLAVKNGQELAHVTMRLDCMRKIEISL